MAAASGGENVMAGLADLVLALRVPLLVLVPLAVLYVGASLHGNRFVAPLLACAFAAGGLLILHVTEPTVVIVALAVGPFALGWSAARLLAGRRDD